MDRNSAVWFARLALLRLPLPMMRAFFLIHKKNFWNFNFFVQQWRYMEKVQI